MTISIGSGTAYLWAGPTGSAQRGHRITSVITYTHNVYYTSKTIEIYTEHLNSSMPRRMAFEDIRGGIISRRCLARTPKEDSEGGTLAHHYPWVCVLHTHVFIIDFYLTSLFKDKKKHKLFNVLICYTARKSR